MTLQRRPIRRTGNQQIFANLIMVRGTFGDQIQLRSSRKWVQDELDRFSSNVFAIEAKPANVPEPVCAVCVYSPAWPVDRGRLSTVDVSDVRLTQNNDVWVTDLLREALLEQRLGPESRWIIAGDFNMCETFDEWRDGPRGNREFLDRLTVLGLTDCLRYSRGSLTPTFKTLRTGQLKSQIDYIFVTDALRRHLVKCDTGPEDLINAGVSDHLPVIADFEAAHAEEPPS